MISDGKMFGATSALYIHCNKIAKERNRVLLTYTFNADAPSVIASGAVYDGPRKPGKDTRPGRRNLTSTLIKHRWYWTWRPGDPLPPPG
jgi:hypothetical protein